MFLFVIFVPFVVNLIRNKGPSMKAKTGCLWGCGGLLGLLLLAWGALLVLQHTVAKWPDPVPGVRLEPSRPILAEAGVKPDNAFYYIRQWKDVKPADSPADESLRWPACGLAGSPYPIFERAIADNAENLALYQKAATLPNCQVVTPQKILTELPEIKVKWHIILLCYRAEKAAAIRDWSSSLDDLRTALVVSSHLSRGGVLIHRLCSIYGHKSTTASLRRIAQERNPPVAFQKTMDAVLAETARTMEPIEETVRQEWLMTHSSFNEFYRDGNPPVLWAYEHGLTAPIGSSPCRSLQMLDSVFSLAINGLERGDERVIQTAIDMTYSRSADTLNSALLGVPPPLTSRQEMRWERIRMLSNPVAEQFLAAFLGSSMYSIKVTLDRSLLERADLDSTRLVLAVRRWELEHGGKPPAALAELVPGYIPAVPEDPFSPRHEPFRYRSDGMSWAVYSVGEDGKDGGGRYSQLDREDKKLHPSELDLVFASDEFQKKRTRYEEQQAKTKK